MATGNRWGRAVGAGVLVEVSVIVLILAAMFVYTRTGVRSEPDKMAFIHDGAAWIACIAGPIMTFVLARWALRGLTSAHMAHALVVAGVAVALHAMSSYGAVKEGHEALWVVILADVLKVAGALAAAQLARQRRSGTDDVEAAGLRG